VDHLRLDGVIDQGQGLKAVEDELERSALRVALVAARDVERPARGV
jgi:hypothetical protein